MAATRTNVSIPLRLADLPEFRAGMAADLVEPDTAHAIVTGWMSAPTAADAWDNPQHVQNIGHLLPSAGLFWITAPMCELVKAAWPTFPIGVHVPHPSQGLAVFEKPMHFEDKPPIFALHYMGGDIGHVWLDMGGDVGVSAPMLMTRPDALIGEHSIGAFKIMLTVFSLIDQRIAIVHQHRPDRAVSRRMRRAGLPIDLIQVIDLRQPVPSPTKPRGTTVDWARRWIIGGHWHRYHTNEGVVLRWVAPYVKGPEDRPLIVDRVHRWSR